MGEEVISKYVFALYCHGQSMLREEGGALNDILYIYDQIYRLNPYP